MATVLESNKTKIARRVIEVFEYFGAENRPATVMDIVRRYGRPQSSTSELLASLVEMGLLYKDPMSRSYTPTPRLATLGSAVQPDFIRDGRLYSYMDRLAQSTRHTVGLFGMVGTHVQVFRGVTWPGSNAPELENGQSELLSGSVAGLLLLSTMGGIQASKILWRLNAEAAVDAKFNHAEASEKVGNFGKQGHAFGDAGFASNAQLAAILLPCGAGQRPLALGVMHAKTAAVDSGALIETLRHGVRQFSPSYDAQFPAEDAPMLRAI